MPELRVTELDFETIKANLKNFLRAQTEFTDYDFDGAGLTVLIDLLSYNTHYNAMLAHLEANEMFIDTAIKRASVVSIAKTLGYIPRSATASRAIVNIVVTPSENSTATTLVLSPSATFTSNANGVSFTFSPAENTTADLIDGVFTFTEVVLLEGTSLSNSFTVAADTLQGPFIIPVDSIDLDTLTLTVADYWSAPNPVTYTRATGIVDVLDTDKVFWVEENPFGQYQVIFGDDIIGKQLVTGNRVTVNYLAVKGASANGCRVFALSGAIDGEVDATVELSNASNPASSGGGKESIDQIRFNAPKFNATRNRAVTAQDYQSLIMSQFSRAKSVAVWGGEDNVPPMYGTVFITLDPNDGGVITEGDKDYITESILRPRSVLSIQYQFVDPYYLYMGFDIDLKYDPRLTTLSASDITTMVHQQISDYFTTNLQTLGKTFLYSQFTDAIISTFPNSDVIVSVLAKMRIQRRVDLLTEVYSSQTVEFMASLNPESLVSNYFQTKVADVLYEVYLQDYHDTDVLDYTGTGTLKLINVLNGKVVHSNVGTVDYKSGRVVLNNLWVNSFFGEALDLRLTATPQELSKNIAPGIINTSEVSTHAIAPLPSKNTVILLDDSTADIASNLTPGVTIKATPYFQTN
jgi:hypothetical protein